MEKNTRIKFKETGEQRCESIKKFLGNEGSLLMVVVDGLSCSVVAMPNTVVETVTACTHKEAKALAKELLKKYGVKFHDEVRAKRKVKQEGVVNE